MMTNATNQDVERVMNALAAADFKWRTVNGVAKETGLSVETVQQAIAQAGEAVVRSSTRSQDGRALFTTREKFTQQASFADRLLGAIRNRVE